MQTVTNRVAVLDSPTNGRPRWRDSLATSGTVTASATGAILAVQLQLGLVIQILLPLSVLVLGVLWLILRQLLDARTELSKLHQQIASLSTAQRSLLPSELSEGSFEVYLSYKSLSAKECAGLLQSFDDIYRVIYGLMNIGLFPNSQSIQSNEMSDGFNEMSDGFFETVEQLLRANPGDRLEIEAIETGESVKFRLKPGWVPSFAVENEDIVVNLPKSFASVAITGYFISGAANYGVNTVKDALETVKTYKEIQKIDHELKELQEKVEQAPQNVLEHFDEKLRAFKELTVRNHDIKGLQVRVRPLRRRRGR